LADGTTGVTDARFEEKPSTNPSSASTISLFRGKDLVRSPCAFVVCLEAALIIGILSIDVIQLLAEEMNEMAKLISQQQWDFRKHLV
jgi:hypothetical protein